MFIDTHTHLYSSQFDDDREIVIQRSIDNGVEKLLLPNIDRSSIQGMLGLQHKYPANCYAMMGLLRQFQRSEEQIYHTVELLMQAGYDINYQPGNVPNKYLQ